MGGGSGTTGEIVRGKRSGNKWGKLRGELERAAEDEDAKEEEGRRSWRGMRVS